MSANNNTALVVHNDANPEGATSSSSVGVVLDALPYVEPLDPNYEQYAISLIEEELHHVVTEQQQQGDNGNAFGIGEHPSLQRILPTSTSFAGGDDNISIATHVPDFGGKAPLAMAAYEALVARRADNGNDDASTPATAPFSINRPDPMAENARTGEEMDQETLVSNLQISIATSKIQLEQERLRLINLELHQNLETPARYTAYASQLESKYLNPTSQAVERQRRVVDGINATRMEEQTQSIGKLEGLSGKWELLVDKNRRLGKALEGLEREMTSLKEVAKRGEESAGEMMDVAEMSKEN
mmetsp:Transcript_8846/g.19843  ORF Transcript_8846/g.19843 Transcript_8846/m.19843 type:complete len:300 (+) Transcript_8846:57-956(+)